MEAVTSTEGLEKRRGREAKRITAACTNRVRGMAGCGWPNPASSILAGVPLAAWEERRPVTATAKREAAPPCPRQGRAAHPGGLTPPGNAVLSSILRGGEFYGVDLRHLRKSWWSGRMHCVKNSCSPFILQIKPDPGTFL